MQVIQNLVLSAETMLVLEIMESTKETTKSGFLQKGSKTDREGGRGEETGRRCGKKKKRDPLFEERSNEWIKFKCIAEEGNYLHA